MVFINENKSCEISNQMSTIQCLHFQKQKRTGYKYCKIKLFSGANLHGAPNESETYLEPSHTSLYEEAFLQK